MTVWAWRDEVRRRGGAGKPMFPVGTSKFRCAKGKRMERKVRMKAKCVKLKRLKFA